MHTTIAHGGLVRLRRMAIASALAALLLPGSAAAQPHLGVDGGPTFASFRGDDIDDVESRTGIYLGVGLEIPVASIVGLRTGLQFVEKGGNIQGNFNVFPELDIVLVGSSAQVEVEVGYLELPLLLQIRPEVGPFDLSVYGGGTLGYNLACDVVFSDVAITVERECIEHVSRSETGLRFGAGVGYRTSGMLSFTLDGGVDIGLSTTEIGGPDVDVRNHVYYVAAGVTWPTSG